MKEEIIIAGFGGQGVMSMGQILTYAGMKEGKEVSWLPSYGPEQRGGTANVSVVISDKTVGSPIIDSPSTVIVLNNPSFEKFEPLVKAGGKLFINSDLVTKKSERIDIEVIDIKATSIADKVGNPRVAGSVILGAYIEKTGIITRDSLITALIQVLGVGKNHLISVNEAAFDAGKNILLENV
ncbi:MULTISPECIES: 2-oxoacid:acceptor oxidoreductase family protein [Bacillaceae]|uniref:2-oxoacid:acceptor oxidoreductase family protein n=1 Tax=Evansella alkalicola TaxID=745819 RepID=A0ABS6JZH4_9BACI|nr:MULTISPECIES: 2-oxoacid:acceptor oxidoreductase family protein [Bacillaceae]MBU9723984.1 2-oxoacid:acceptor oxidoreductase family protein [Bacillus alkalicola]